MNINDLTNTIQSIKDAKEDLRSAINEKGGTLANDAKLSEFKEAVENLPSGGSATSVDFGSSYSESPESIAQQLKEDLAFTAEVERGIESGEYTPSNLIAGTQKVLFNGQEYVFKGRVAFYPRGMKVPNSCEGYDNLREWRLEGVMGYSRFKSCRRLQSFASNLSSLEDGSAMFAYCTSLESIAIDLSSLETGSTMFGYCSSLQSFTSDLSSLETGNSMFIYCISLKSFASDLSSLKNGDRIFAYCSSLESIASDLSSLEISDAMFYSCTALKNVEILGWGKCNLSLAQSSKLTPLSIHNLISAGCKTYKESVDNGEDGGTRVLTLHATALSNWKNSEYYEEDSAQASAHEITVK